MTIRYNCKKEGRCYIKSMVPDWSMFDGCFSPTRVSVSDVDGMVHQAGKHLILEKKNQQGVLEPPQVRSLQSHAAKGDTGIAFWCDDPLGTDISGMRVFGMNGYDSTIRIKATLEDVRYTVRQWWTATYKPGRV